MLLKKHIVIVAGGSGKRMQTQIPKQFLEINGLPVLMHTINVFKEACQETPITLVLPETDISLWENLCEKHSFIHNVNIVFGGITRFQSVKNGLDAVADDALVAIHDGVRPLVNTETIKNCFIAAEKYGAAVPVLPVKDSLRVLKKHSSSLLDRSLYRIVQTPQCFQYQIIKTAYKQAYNKVFTDDASVVEAAGFSIALVDGNEENIKITTEADLVIAKAFLSR